MPREAKRPAVFLAAESFTAGKGGICRVARLMAKVLAEKVLCGEMSAQAAVLNGEGANLRVGLDVTAAGSRLQSSVREIHAALLQLIRTSFDGASFSARSAPIAACRA